MPSTYAFSPQLDQGRQLVCDDEPLGEVVVRRVNDHGRASGERLEHRPRPRREVAGDRGGELTLAVLVWENVRDQGGRFRPDEVDGKLCLHSAPKR